jgi:hypothetical protein
MGPSQANDSTQPLDMMFAVSYAHEMAFLLIFETSWTKDITIAMSIVCLDPLLTYNKE